MKYGIITDIHSNYDAFEMILNKFEKINVDKIICCGDIIGIGPYSEKVVKKIMSISDKLIAVRGNHENYLLNGLPKKVHDDKRGLSENEINCHLWNQNQLTETSKVFLNNLKNEESIEFEGIKIVIVHYPTNEDGMYMRHIKNATEEECEEIFRNYDANIYLYGHTHTKNIIKSGNNYYINVGSLGCPSDSNLACAGILTLEDGNISFDDIEIEYDVEKVIKDIETLNYPMSYKILDIFYGCRHLSKK